MLRLVASGVVNQHLSAMPAAEACLFVPDSAGQVLRVAHATPGVRDSLAGLQLCVGEGLSGWVAANRRTSVTSAPALDFGDPASLPGLRSCLMTPVVALGHPAGLLSAYSPAAGGVSGRVVIRGGRPSRGLRGTHPATRGGAVGYSQACKRSSRAKRAAAPIPRVTACGHPGQRLRISGNRWIVMPSCTSSRGRFPRNGQNTCTS